MLAMAEELRAAWRCPWGGHQPAKDTRELPEAQREALVAVEKLTSVRGLTTCPLAELRTQTMYAVCAAKTWRDKGCIRERVGWPTLAMAQAIDALESGWNARQAHEERERQRQRAEKDSQ